MKNCLIGCILLLFMANPVFSQQIADDKFSYNPFKVQYEQGKGTQVFLDEAHDNFHTKSGRYAPFAKVLETDGYVVKKGKKKFNSDFLSNIKILVIANAGDVNPWALPTASAFTNEEIKCVNDWVREGGSLFIIADHMPFAGAAAKLAATFGIKFINGFALRKDKKSEYFFKQQGNLLDNILTRGNSPEEEIDSLQCFTGQAFSVPESVKKITVLDTSYIVLMPNIAFQFNDSTPTISGAGLTNGAFMEFGKGRVLVMGEAAMFSAQLAGPQQSKVGMNHPKSRKNAQFLLNCVHWLDRKL